MKRCNKFKVVELFYSCIFSNKNNCLLQAVMVKSFKSTLGLKSNFVVQFVVSFVVLDDCGIIICDFIEIRRHAFYTKVLNIHAAT